VAEDKNNEEEKFDFTSEGEGYISLDEARVLAIRTASQTPGVRSSRYRDVPMAFEVISTTEEEETYDIVLSYRPQGDFTGTPGQEHFIIAKHGEIILRQVWSTPKEPGGLPIIPISIGVVVVGIIAAVGAVFAMNTSGGDSIPVAAVSSPIETEDTSETLAPTHTPQPTSTSTSTPDSTSTSDSESGAVLVTKWGTQGTGNGQFHHPNGVSLASDSSVYVAEWHNNRIQKFTSDGVFVTKWGTGGTGDGEFNSPAGVAVASDSSVYVAEVGNNRIQKFTSDGMFITKWGTKGSGDGEFARSQDIAVASDGSVYVADEENYRIQKFTSDGMFVTKWGFEGSGNGEFVRPHGVAVASDGSVYVADEGNHRIQKFTSEGVFVSKWGTEGYGDGQFYSPRGISVASNGSVYVTERNNHRIQKFTSEGVFVSKWGTQGSGDDQFHNPVGVEVTSNGSVYVADTDNHRIQKFTSDGAFVTKWGSYTPMPTYRPTPTAVPATKAPAPVGGGDSATLEIDVQGDALYFSVADMFATASGEVSVTFTNSSSVNSHNWALVENGTKDAVSADGTGTGAGPSNNWLPVDDSRVIGNTMVLSPGQSDTTTFTAPAAGTYQFVCTFPGHNFTMFGDFIVN
jgi:azurin